MTTPDTWRLPPWTLLSNHGHVLLAIARDPRARLRDVAARVGITERAAHTIVADLEEAGYLARHRVGRRNEYTVNPHVPFRHPAECDHMVGELLALFTGGPHPPAPAGPPPAPAGPHPTLPGPPPAPAGRPTGPQSRNGGSFAPVPHPSPEVDCSQVQLKE